MAKYTVGERVVAAKALPRYGISRGETVEVIEVDASDADLPYRVCRKNGQRAWVHASVIEDVPSAEAPTLRDQFAMAAVSSGRVDFTGAGIPLADRDRFTAEYSYRIADAMLAAREAK